MVSDAGRVCVAEQLRPRRVNNSAQAGLFALHLAQCFSLPAILLLKVVMCGTLHLDVLVRFVVRCMLGAGDDLDLDRVFILTCSEFLFSCTFVKVVIIWSVIIVPYLSSSTCPARNLPSLSFNLLAIDEHLTCFNHVDSRDFIRILLLVFVSCRVTLFRLIIRL